MANCPTPFCEAEYFVCRGVLVSRIVPQRDVGVLEAEDRQVFLLLLQRLQAEDLSVERLRALKVADYQIDGE
jgi:hypothetical protein